jgi:hypothetical protein
MPRNLSPPEPNEPSDRPSPFAAALTARDLAPLTEAPVGSLLEQLTQQVKSDDVSLELAALRLLLYRLLTEQHDLPQLSTLLARVVTVALHAARTTYHVRQHDAADLLDAVTVILQELGDHN